MILRHAVLPLACAAALLLSGAPAHAGVAVRVESVEYPGSEGEMPAKIYVPDGSERLPGILVLHTISGPGPNVEAFARDLAAAGYVALTPDVFSLHDFGPDGRTDHPLILKDVDGALAHLQRHPRVARDRIAVVGFSFGGRLAVLAAALYPERVRAVVTYYAITSHQDLGRPLAGSAARAQPLSRRVNAIKAPVLIHHGETDGNVPASQARLLHDALLAAAKPSTLHLYPGADHLFNFSIGPDVRYHPAAARLSWERTLAFLNRHLKQP